MCKKTTQICRDSEIIGYTHVSSSQWTQSDAYRLKTAGEVGFALTGNVTFQESIYNMHFRKVNNYTSRTNRRHESGEDIAWISK